MTANGNGYISRGNMTVILSAAGLVMIAFGGFITFQNSATDRRIEDIKTDIARIGQGYLRKDEHEEFKLRVDKDITRIEAARLRDADKIVPRDELTARLAAIETNAKIISDRLNELRAMTTAPYPVREEISRLNAEIVELRRALNEKGK